jgi:hypothetical protein
MCPQDGVTIEQKNSQKSRILESSVPDSRHFGTRIRTSESDPDPGLFVSDLQDTIKNLFFLKCFWLLLFEGTFNHSSQIKSHKGKKKFRNQGFSY